MHHEITFSFRLRDARINPSPPLVSFLYLDYSFVREHFQSPPRTNKRDSFHLSVQMISHLSLSLSLSLSTSNFIPPWIFQRHIDWFLVIKLPWNQITIFITASNLFPFRWENLVFFLFFSIKKIEIIKRI